MHKHDLNERRKPYLQPQHKCQCHNLTPHLDKPLAMLWSDKVRNSTLWPQSPKVCLKNTEKHEKKKKLSLMDLLSFGVADSSSGHSQLLGERMYSESYNFTS